MGRTRKSFKGPAPLFDVELEAKRKRLEELGFKRRAGHYGTRCWLRPNGYEVTEAEAFAELDRRQKQ